MAEPYLQKLSCVLTRQETRNWHSPYSRMLRETRRRRILSECEKSANESGLSEYLIFDADENLIFEGFAPAPPPGPATEPPDPD